MVLINCLLSPQCYTSCEKWAHLALGNRIKLSFHLSKKQKTKKVICWEELSCFHNFDKLGWWHILVGREFQRGRMFACINCCVLYSMDWEEGLVELQQNFYRNNFWPAAAGAAWRIDMYTYLAQRCWPTKVLTSGLMDWRRMPLGLPHTCNQLVRPRLQNSTTKLPDRFNQTDVAFQLQPFKM